MERAVTLSERVATAVGSALERRMSRRSALARAAVAGSAFAVAPLRYLLRPGTAWAVIRPSDCESGKCTDGYTAFCCEIHHGLNSCPAGTYVAGWWKCTDYAGTSLCAARGIRYYVDCNRIPGLTYGFGCHCAKGDCNRRRVDCNHFRYGQCNAQVVGTTEVVCRLVVCQNPTNFAQFGCNDTLKVDNSTCTHEAPCLERLALKRRRGGGA